ncbi:MAG: APC family permease [Lachnospiraceae bacterium]
MEKKKLTEGSTRIKTAIIKPKQHYGFFTATTMIIGIVIGSGIFFKSDDILHYTNGNVMLGILVFCIAAFGIIFGSLTLIELTKRTDKSGGIVAYYEEFVSNRSACGFGWFQTFVYFPTLTVVVSWVAGIYTCSFFGLPGTLEMQTLIGIGYLLIFYLTNLISAKASGRVQNFTTFIKLIPLLFIAVLGFFWSSFHPGLETEVAINTAGSQGFAWLAALVPTAFSFDGWVIATSITNEVKNPKKNMTLALIIGPIVILAVYLSFFIGITRILGVDYILEHKDAAIGRIGEMIPGGHGTQILLIFVIISVLGVVNGLVLGALRMPHALAVKKMIPHAESVEILNERVQISNKAWCISLVTCLIWYVVHYLTQMTNVLDGGDISEIAIVFSYACYIVLYVRVIGLRKSGEIKNVVQGILFPTCAIIGAGIIFVGGFITNPIYVTFFMLFCLTVFYSGFRYYKIKHV